MQSQTSKTFYLTNSNNIWKFCHNCGDTTLNVCRHTHSNNLTASSMIQLRSISICKLRTFVGVIPQTVLVYFDSPKFFFCHIGCSSFTYLKLYYIYLYIGIANRTMFTKKYWPCVHCCVTTTWHNTMTTIIRIDPSQIPSRPIGRTQMQCTNSSSFIPSNIFIISLTIFVLWHRLQGTRHTHTL